MEVLVIHYLLLGVLEPVRWQRCYRSSSVPPCQWLSSETCRLLPGGHWSSANLDVLTLEHKQKIHLWSNQLLDFCFAKLKKHLVRTSVKPHWVLNMQQYMHHGSYIHPTYFSDRLAQLHWHKNRYRKCSIPHAINPSNAPHLCSRENLLSHANALFYLCTITTLTVILTPSDLYYAVYITCFFWLPTCF